MVLTMIIVSRSTTCGNSWPLVSLASGGSAYGSVSHVLVPFSLVVACPFYMSMKKTKQELEGCPEPFHSMPAGDM